MAEKTPYEIALERIRKVASTGENSLDLSKLQLTLLPAELWQLTNLVSLNISFNKLTSLPAELWQLSNLVSLNISGNKLTSLPAELWQLSNLVSLNISGNDLTSLPAEIGQLTNLTNLNLSNIALTRLPIEIGRLTHLTALNLSSNKLTDLPLEFWKLTELTYLDLSYNQFTYLSNNIAQLTRLNYLGLILNKLHTLPSTFWKLRNLTKLDLSGINLGSLSTEIDQLTRLEILDLSNNYLAALPAELFQLPNLHELDLSLNKISYFPTEIYHLTNLTKLSLSHTGISNLPTILWQLSNLTDLNLSGNQLIELPAEIGQLTNLNVLNLIGNSITSLPPEIGHLTNLTQLSLSDNQLVDLPTEFWQLTNLTVLSLDNNKFVSVAAGIGNLTKLKELSFSRNRLTYLPAEIGHLTNLVRLHLSNRDIFNKKFFPGNQIKKLPVEIKRLKRLLTLDLRDNLLNIPPEILNQFESDKIFFASESDPPYTILKYYFSSHRPLGEVKLILVGQGSVGKTSIIKRILYDTFDVSQGKTDGIATSTWQISGKSKIEGQQLEVTVNIWDFGGQEIMHATHQFFFTTRSIYLLVLDNRLTAEANNLDYWMKIIETFGGASPVLIVGNKSDQHPIDIDSSGLRERYPNIARIIETSAVTGAGIENLKGAIKEQVNNLPHVWDLLPATWFNVKKHLELLNKKNNFINYGDYVKICAENDITDEGDQRSLIGFLHDLGVILHFPDNPRLEFFVIVNPQWVTNGVYKILNSRTLFQNKGVLTTNMLDEILNLPEYPRDKRLFIVDTMKRFELCYAIESDKTFLIPDLLPKDEPAKLKFNGVPAFEYAYPVLPSSVITRFIVRMNQKIDDGLVWRTGVVLKIGENKALVKADIEDRKITIAIDGLEHTRRDALSAIRYQLDEIHESIKGLNPEKYIPVPNAVSAKPLKYEYLLKLERAGKEFLDVEDGNELREINIAQMLNGVESEYQRKQYGNVTNINIHGSVSRSTIIVGDKNQVIQDSYNKINSAEITPELKETLKQLAEAVDVMIQKLPTEQAAEVAEDFGKLTDEAVKPKPNQKWYSVSIEGLIKAAENLDKLGTPVISLSRKVLSLLMGGVIK